MREELMAATIDDVLKSVDELRATVAVIQGAVVRESHESLHKSILELRSTIGALQSAIVRSSPQELHKAAQELRSTAETLEAAILRHGPVSVVHQHQSVSDSDRAVLHEMAKGIIQNVRARIIGARIDGDTTIGVGDVKTYTMSAMAVSLGCESTVSLSLTDEVNFSWFTRPIVPESGSASEAGLVVVRTYKDRPWRAEVIGMHPGELDLYGRIALTAVASCDNRVEQIVKDVTLRINVTEPAHS
jgi:uncharacterized small protein (DUF1192 family)